MANPLSAQDWIELLFDRGSFDERFEGVRTPDPLRFEDSRPYRQRLKEAREKTGHMEAVWTGTARLGGHPVVVAVSDFRFIGGSMGFAVGQRVAEAMEEARGAKLPFVALTCSGGARMQEGMVALVQMAKTAAAAARLHEAGVPMISVLADPTTGGVFASYATQADIVIAEAGAAIGFAGGRVRAVHDQGDAAETLYAEDLLETGQADAVVAREKLRDCLVRLVQLVRRGSAPDLETLPPPVDVEETEPSWDAVQQARHPQRPRTHDYVRELLDEFFPLHGDRSGVDDPALVAGLGRIGDTTLVLVGQERAPDAADPAAREGRISPAGYRKAIRAIHLADRLRLPLLTLVDTPGARDALADERAGLAGAISDCLTAMATITTPCVSVVTGEGGSGGALALTVADRILMLQHAIFAVTSPEGAAAILYRDRERAPEVAEALKITAQDLKRLGIVDRVIPEPTGGAHADPDVAIRMLAPELRRALAEAMRGKGAKRRRRREKRLERIGRTRLWRLEQAADLLGGASEVAVHAFDLGARAIGLRRPRPKAETPS